MAGVKFQTTVRNGKPTEIEEDYFLLLEANKRLDDNGNKETVSYDSVMKHLGISEAELLEAEDADIE